MPKQGSDERPGRRFKRRKRRRGKRGAVSERRGRDKSVEGKDRQFRDRGKEKRPGDRKERKSFERSRNRSPKRRERRQGGEREKSNFRPRTGRPGDQRGPDRQNLGGIRDEINQIKQRREQFSQRRPEEVATDRGFDPERLKGLPGGPQQGGDFRQQEQPAPGPQPTNLDQVNAYDAAPEYAQPQPALAPAPQQPVIGPDGSVGQPVQPQPAPVQAGVQDPAAAGGVPDIGYTPAEAPGPTAPPGVATDAYGKPAQPGSGPYAPQPFPAPQVNPRAAGMDRFAQPPQQRRPEELPRGPAPV